MTIWEIAHNKKTNKNGTIIRGQICTIKQNQIRKVDITMKI